ncbi:MAG: BREX-1 system phosphatase PglZ type B [Candidatus Bathyarchaeia archaeon]|jgi:hypothetical protein
MQVIDYLINKIHATATNYNPDIQTVPACVLWLDSENQWKDATQAFLTKLPELLVFGEYCPEKRTGPAIWLRCAIAGKADEIQLPTDRIPIIYLPGTGRQDLRADKIKEALRPLAELQYRSVVWSQINSKDWTVLAFLKSDQGGLGLDVAQDNDTKNAMLRALDPLLDMDIEALKGERLDKDFFNSIYAGDYVRLVLQWLDQGDSFKTNLGEKRWQAFVEMCESKLTFNPDKDGPLSGAKKLASRDSQWQPVWDRFCEAPKRYPNIPKRVRNCKPPASMDWYSPGKTTYNRWPQWNDAQENNLRKSLSDIDNNPPLKAREKILELEKEHRSRRNLIWAELCEAPLAQSLEHLAILAETTAKRLVMGSADDLMKEYQSTGWQADDAVLRALAYVEKQQDIEVITKSIRAIYVPWAEESARYLQKVIDENGYPLQRSDKKKDGDHKNGDCILFVDGLRFDAAKRLAGLLKVCGYQIKEKPAWAPLPTVTSTGKPAVSPIKNRIVGKDAANSFEPSVADTGQPLNAYYLKKLLIEAGWQILDVNQSGDVNGNGWIEFGDIDRAGHERGWKIVKQIDAILADISDQVITLLNSGWKKVKIVTDHGWLLMPGDLPKIELPSAQTATKWGRCAAIKPGAVTDGQLYPWYWNPNQHFALANGISCFRNGTEYDHGGISLQECVIMELEVSPSESHTFHIAPEITDIAWKGLRCTIATDSVYEGLSLDIRTQPGDSTSSIVVRTQPLKENGTASVVVENEDLEGSNSTIVLINQKGELVAQIDTFVGGEENR